MINILKRSQAIAILLFGLLVLMPACTHQEAHQVGSHKVTVERHGFQKKLDVDKQAGTFDYAGISTVGEGLKVSIAGDKVKVNGRDYGKLRPGDSVHIGDDGVRVNSLDYGESEKYLRANVSTSEGSVVN